MNLHSHRSIQSSLTRPRACAGSPAVVSDRLAPAGRTQFDSPFIAYQCMAHIWYLRRAFDRRRRRLARGGE